jgi:hypothetical protein
MKNYFSTAALVGLLVITSSCRKDDGCEYDDASMGMPERRVRYELFTRDDFSGNAETIFFSLFMRKGSQPVFDSALAPMRVEDIPDSLHRIIIEKPVPDGITDTLIVGINYSIEDVGTSWHEELFPANDTFKLLRFSFH